MKTKIITIGNSKGIRLTRHILQESGVQGAVDVTVKKGEIKIVPLKDTDNLNSFAGASENSFSRDWSRPEEEEAWKSYQ